MFIEVLKETASLWNINVTAYCLMPNHYHLLLKTPEGNLSRSMRHINGVYTQRYNRKHGQDGPLFRGRYKAILVERDNYLLGLVKYIHRNPLRARMIKRLNDYPWSSHKGYLSESKKWNWISKEPLFTLLTKFKSMRLREYKDFVNENDSKEITDFMTKKNTPSILGSEKFRNWIKEKYSDFLFQEEIPAAKALVPSMEKIKRAVCKVYNVKPNLLFGIRRGYINEPRNVAIYLTRLLRRDSLKVIGNEFRIPNYSSISTIIEKLKVNIVRDTKLKKNVEKIIKLVNVSQ